MDPLLKKLNHKPGTAVTVLGVPPEVVPVVEAWSGETKVKRRLGKGEAFVLAFVRTSAELAERAPKLVGALVDDGVLWIAYPKKSSPRYTSDLSRDDSWQPLGQAGMEPVRQVAVDADWSALRFRRAEHIGQLTRDPTRLLSQQARRRVASRSKAPADPPEVAEFLAALPEDRRTILTRVHEVIRTAAPQLEPAVTGNMLGYGPFHYRYATGREGDAYVVKRGQPEAVRQPLSQRHGGRRLPGRGQRRPAGQGLGGEELRAVHDLDLDLDVLAELVRTAARNPASTG